jgi:hypothetical protein
MSISRIIRKVGGTLSGLAAIVIALSGAGAAGSALSSCSRDISSSSYADTNRTYDTEEQEDTYEAKPDIHPNSITCLLDQDNDGYGIKENNVIVPWGETCPDKYVDKLPFDCNDNDPSVNPGMIDNCDGKDNNCNGKIDEDAAPAGCMTECGIGKKYCKDGVYQGCDAPTPKDEKCDGKDNDCDGKTDEGLTKKCTNACGNEGIEKCIDGKYQNCNAKKGTEEVCDNIDNNCNGKIDEGIEIKCYTDCGEGKIVCKDGEFSDCDAQTKCCTPGEIKEGVPCPITAKVFMFVIDNSGSMGGSDPENLRYYGAIEFVKKTESEEKSGLIVYSTDATLIGKITNSHSEMISYINQALEYGLGGSTNIPDAMYLAIDEVNKYSYNKIIILLTDGQSNVGNFNPGSIKQEAESNGIRIYTLGLGAEVNNTELNDLATSDGNYYFIDTAQDISSIYSTIFNKSKYEYWKECNANQEWIEKNGQCN